MINNIKCSENNNLLSSVLFTSDKNKSCEIFSNEAIRAKILNCSNLSQYMNSVRPNSLNDHLCTELEELLVMFRASLELNSN